MAFTRSTVTTNIIRALADQPTETATQLKTKFDEYAENDKAYTNNTLLAELEKTTAGSSGAENIGSATISGVTGTTVRSQISNVKTQLDARNAENVKLTGDQTIAGIKTFSSSPVVPVASADTQAPQKKYVDDENLKDVHLTGNQTVAGVKTFSSSPVVPTPTTTTQASNKGYVDGVAADFVLGTLSQNSVTNDMIVDDSKIGSLATLSALLTGFTSSITVAINKIVSWIGDLSTLTTTETGSLVGSINEVFGRTQAQTGTALPATTGTITVTMDGKRKTLTPSGACTLNPTGGNPSDLVTFIITTSGTTSYVITFGSDFASQGTLTTGTVSGKRFTVTFVKGGGTLWFETGRTVAM